ncbi:GlcG/HbpS family heme-binding protein [Rhodococcus koreensis]
MSSAIDAADLGAATAERLLNAAVEKALELGSPSSIAVVDSGGHLLAFRRMDGAPLLSVDAVLNKAWTAASTGVSTAQWFSIVTSDPVLREGMVHTPRFSMLGGGVPLFAGSRLVGAVAVAGGHYNQDDEIASTAVGAVALVAAAGGAR